MNPLTVIVPIGFGLLILLGIAASGKPQNQNGETNVNIPQGNLSPNFTMAEMVRSNTANRLGIPNIPTEQEIENARQFANNTLEKVRAILNAPIKINSWFRSRTVNDAIPGSANDSVHMTGFAADIAVPYGMDKVTAFKKLVKAINQGALQVGELIIYRDTNHFHITEFPHGGRNELLIAKKEGGPKYVAWSEANWVNGR